MIHPGQVPTLLVTCSRTWFKNDDGHAEARRRIAVTALGEAARLLTPTRPEPGEGLLLVHGDARDGDRDLRDIWASWGLPHWPVSARWDKCGPDCPRDLSCRRRVRGRPVGWCITAGHRRNQEMVDLGPDLYLALIRDRSGGATDCADRADRAGIPGARRHFPDTTLDTPWPDLHLPTAS